jgi:hypothetical protein
MGFTLIYVVSGYRRSGTSMMMKAIYDGMKDGAVLYQPGEHEKTGNKPVEGYIPNPSGLWEVGQMYYMNSKFLREMPQSSLVKILYDGLPTLPKGRYTIIFMRRDPKEIKQSCERVDKHLRQVGVVENPKQWYPFDCFRPYRQEEIEHVLGICEARQDMRVIQVDFSRVIESPLTLFRALKNAGLPIDHHKSAAVINPNYYRCRGAA